MKLKTKNYKLLSLKWGIALHVVILHYEILFEIPKISLKKNDQKWQKFPYEL